MPGKPVERATASIRAHFLMEGILTLRICHGNDHEDTPVTKARKAALDLDWFRVSRGKLLRTKPYRASGWSAGARGDSVLDGGYFEQSK